MTYNDLIATIKSSTYDPAFYVRAKSHTLSTPLKTLTALGIFAIGITLIVAYSGLVRFSYTDFLDQALATYPDELEITVAHGELSINQPEPYAIKNPLPKDFTGTTSPDSLIIFDTGDTLGDDPQAVSTFFLVKKTHFISQDGTPGQSQTTQFEKETATTTLAKTDVVGFVEAVRPYFKPGIIIGGLFMTILGVLLGTFVWILLHMIYVLFPALVIFLITRIRKLGFTYGEAYVTALYASIPVAIGSFVLTVIGLPLPTLGYSALLVIVAMINITHAEQA